MAMRRHLLSRPSTLRQPACSRLMRRADMNRAAFVGLVLGWTGWLVVILSISAIARSIG